MPRPTLKSVVDFANELAAAGLVSNDSIVLLEVAARTAKFVNRCLGTITPKQVSVDAGLTWVTPNDAVNAVPWEVLRSVMEENARRRAISETPTNPDATIYHTAILTRYLECAEANLVLS